MQNTKEQPRAPDDGTSAELTIGKTYKVNSSRKGVFTGILTKCCDTWATLLITHGKAKAMLEYNESEQGEEVIVRRAFCTFTEVKGDAA